MKVVILCGGLGTRLREQTEFIPKPMLPIGGKPILWHIMKIYHHQGFSDFVLPLGYKGDVIKDYFVNYKWKSSDFTLEVQEDNRMVFHDEHKCERWRIHFIDTGSNSSTGLRIHLVRKLLEDDERFMLTYGDGVADIDLNDLLEFHIRKGVLGTLTGHKPTSRFGIIDEEDGIVLGFREKPQSSDYINSGFMVFERGALDYFNGDDVMLETGVLPMMARDRQLAIYNHVGSWYWMDTQRDWERLNSLWETNPSWRMWEG
jgi:glucose-1-phosphate cytidylyltransferase